MRPRLSILVFGLLALSPSSEADAQWTARRFHPEGAHYSQINAIAGGREYGEVDFVGGPDAPAVWTSPSTWSSLSPGPDYGGPVLGASETSQVGAFQLKAALWSGTPQSYVNLHRPEWYGSEALATWGDEQVGDYESATTFQRDAVLWRGSAESAVVLNPAGAIGSTASAVWNDVQGGAVQSADFAHASLWHGSAGSMVDLHPGGQYRNSGITAMTGGQQVGGVQNGNAHAAIWSGTAASMIDVNPPGAGFSYLTATCGSAQAGNANVASYGNTAGVWFGTADSFIPLAQFLPPGYAQSAATSIYFDGTTYFVGGYATNALTRENEAFVWTGVPAPGSLMLVFSAGVLVTRRRRERGGGCGDLAVTRRVRRPNCGPSSLQSCLD